jgi:hypothetical protein
LKQCRALNAYDSICHSYLGRLRDHLGRGDSIVVAAYLMRAIEATSVPDVMPHEYAQMLREGKG